MMLSVIIPLGRPERAADTFESIQAQNWIPEEWELIVVGPDAVEMKYRYAKLPIIPVKLHQREYPGKTRHAGTKRAKGEWYLFIDDDVHLSRDYFDELRKVIERFHRKDFRVGAIAGRLPGVVGNFSDNLVNYANFWYQQNRVEKEKSWFYSAAVAISSKAYEEAGGFSEKIPIGEDVDLTDRIRNKGYSLQYRPALQAYHDHKRTNLRKAFGYFVDNGGFAQYFHQDNPPVRVFSLRTILHFVINDFRANREENAKEFRRFWMFAPFIILCYFILQISIEVNWQKHLREGERFRNFEEGEKKDRFARRSFEAFARGKTVMGLGYYSLGIVCDLFGSPRR